MTANLPTRPALTFTPIPGRTSEYYVSAAGIHLGRVKDYPSGWGYHDLGGRPANTMRYLTRQDAAETLQARHTYRAADRAANALTLTHDRRAHRHDLICPGVM